MIRCLSAVCLSLIVLGEASAQNPGDWPLFGGTPARNMANPAARNIPAQWAIGKPGKNILWSAELGTKSYGGPVVAGGKVFVGTNDRKATPQNKKYQSILMCFDEKTGKQLWEFQRPLPPDPILSEVSELGLLSTPAIAGDRAYFVLPECILVCVNVKNGKPAWEYDMRQELKVSPFHCGNCSPLVVGNLVFLVTSNGIDEKLKAVRNPDAPSFIAVNKDTGKLVWQSNLPGKNIIDGQWSNPAYAVINGKPQVIFPGGDATLYSFEPKTGKLIWKCHCHPTTFKGKKPYIIATPVIHDNKVHVGLGVYPTSELPKHSFFLCIDATKTGDVSPGTSYDPKAADNKNSAILWSYGGSNIPRPKTGRQAIFGSTISTCAIHDGLIYLAEDVGYLHCVDAKTGARQWMLDLKTNVWGSPYYADGKVFLCTEDGEVAIFEASRQLKPLARVDMDEGMHGTPIVANGVLFVATKKMLYAIK